MKNNFDQIIQHITEIEKQLKIIKKYVKLYNIKNRKEINVNQNI
ncbi:MAG: hypothetical protein QFY14_02595 [Candidatus Phytoplasma pruni]|nr:hypothetical protein [Candidatus Phytoplasma pruni]